MDFSPPIAARGFVEPPAFEEILQQEAPAFPDVRGLLCRIGTFRVGIEFEAGVAFECFDDQDDSFLAGHAVGPIGGFPFEGVEHIDVERGIATGEHAEKPQSAGLAEECGGEVFGRHDTGGIRS